MTIAVSVGGLTFSLLASAGVSVVVMKRPRLSRNEGGIST
jgi:hypothetical protein